MLQVERLRKWIRRRRASRNLGCTFTRQRGFAVPSSIVFDNRRFQITFPEHQPGITSDFVNVILDDDYGMTRSSSRTASTIVDIGANIGLFSLWARITNPSAQIHAYEPNPRALPFLESNVGCLDVKVHGAAVGAGHGTVNLPPTSDLTCQRVEFDKTASTPMLPLSAVVEAVGGRIDILKMDCEGFEWEIFQDIEAFGSIREIRMEYHLTDGRSLEDLRNAAAAIGFTITHISARSTIGIAHMTNSKIFTRPQQGVPSRQQNSRMEP